ncbi:MAG: type II toxin-antitoxin system VapC family toxin [Acidovorax sp.]|uniref:type II toxin-antitoxin system VapC family toxin n=1 Tax=Acidovorax sp. TaxID=1872122 RepID=UPI0039E63327
MLAVDTNVVIRFLVDDDPAQHRRAVALFRKHVVWLPKTVLLECEWVLRSAFGFERAEVAQALRALAALPRVRCEDLAAVTAALDAMAEGMDFADALHVASSLGADEGFASFDVRLVRRARKHWPVATVLTP